MEHYEEHPEFSEYGRDPRFRPGWYILPMLALVLIISVVAVFTLPAHAQTATGVSGAVAGSASKSASLAASSGNQITYNSNGGQVEYSGSYRLENVPGVTPPGFSSGHPCAYAPVSFGVGIVGGGASAGGQRIDNACLLAQMGYTREAMAMIAARDPAAMAALEATGQVQGPSTRPASSASSKSTPKAVALLSKCEKTGNKITVAYTAAGRKNKATAIAQCKQRLGY